MITIGYNLRTINIIDADIIYKDDVILLMKNYGMDPNLIENQLDNSYTIGKYKYHSTLTDYEVLILNIEDIRVIAPFRSLTVSARDPIMHIDAQADIIRIELVLMIQKGSFREKEVQLHHGGYEIVPIIINSSVNENVHILSYTYKILDRILPYKFCMYNGTSFTFYVKPRVPSMEYIPYRDICVISE